MYYFYSWKWCNDIVTSIICAGSKMARSSHRALHISDMCSDMKNEYVFLVILQLYNSENVRDLNEQSSEDAKVGKTTS